MASPPRWGQSLPHPRRSEPLDAPQERASAARGSEAELQDAKRQLEAAESRGRRLELQQQVLEGELQRARVALGERRVEAQAMQERGERLQKQVTA